MATKHLILCIDDDPEDVEMLREAFRKLSVDYEFVQATNGVLGLKLLRDLALKNEQPCLIVLDINMPKMDGRETFIALKKDPVLSDIPTVIFSTSSSGMDKMFFSKKNVEYFVKPIDFQKLSVVAGTFLKMCEDRTSEN
jgi:CheY-like chemotaxis protein